MESTLPRPDFTDSSVTLSSSRASAKIGVGHWVALGALMLGAIAVVLAAAPFKQFDLDRHLAPKELALHVAAVMAAVALLVRSRELRLTVIDCCLAAFLVLSFVSALFADNWWLATRALAVSLSAAAVFWSARTVAAAKIGRPLLIALAVGVVIGAVTALLQAYGLVSDAVSELASLSRAPGGTFGNRNFMAHLSAIGIPLLFYLALTAKGGIGRAVASIGIAIVAAAIFLSRSRASWLALLACGFVIAALWILMGVRRRWPAERLAARAMIPAVAGGVAVALALVLPNRLNWKSDSPYLDSVRGVVDYRTGSGRGRVMQYQNTARMALRHPLLGVGPGNWPVDYPRFAVPNDPSLSPDDGRTSNPWPSSDWMAFLSERGLVSFLSLGFAILGLLLTGVMRMRRAVNSEEYLAAATLLGVLIVATIEGAFDAVMLLAGPSLYVWALAGALSAPAEGRALVTLGSRGRRVVFGVATLGGVLLVARSALVIGAMSVYSESTRLSAVERAARLDPGSYRIRLKLASLYAQRGDCRHAKTHAGAAREMFPNAPEPKRLLRACGVR
jgi:O-antigen ligase